MTKQKSKKKPEVVSKTTKENAVVVQPTTDKEPIFMAEEVDTLEQMKKSIKSETKSKLQQMIGKTLTVAQEELDALIAAGAIGSFRSIAKGQMFTGDFQADRVQLFLTGDEITDLEIG